MIADHRHLDVAAMARTLRVSETACCARRIAKLSQLGSIQAARYWVQEGIECGAGRNPAGRKCADVGAAEVSKGDSTDLAADGL